MKDESVPVAGDGPGLAPMVSPGLRVLVVGFNPSIRAFQLGHYYAGRGNWFYRLLHLAGLTPRVLSPVEDALLVNYGVGVMDLSSTPSARAHDLNQGTFLIGADHVKHIVESMAPQAVCCNGYGVYAILEAKRPVRSGLQPDVNIGGAPVFAMPSSSGAAAAFANERRAGWIELGAYLSDNNQTPLQAT